jgi:hypothetical protein
MRFKIDAMPDQGFAAADSFATLLVQQLVRRNALIDAKTCSRDENRLGWCNDISQPYQLRRQGQSEVCAFDRPGLRHHLHQTEGVARSTPDGCASFLP